MPQPSRNLPRLPGGGVAVGVERGLRDARFTIDLTTIGYPPGRPILSGNSLPPNTVPPLPGYIRLDAGSMTLDLEANGYVRTLGGDSPWDDNGRPGRVAFTAYRGGTGLRIAAPVLLDGTYDGEPVDREWGELERLARPPRGQRPPILKIAGAVPRNRIDERWVLDAFPEKDPESVIEDSHNRCLRATTTLILRQFIAPDIVDDDEGGDAPGAGNRDAVVTARRGDTLRDIAKRPKVFGDARKWQQLARLNPDLPRPPRELKDGATVKIPPNAGGSDD